MTFEEWWEMYSRTQPHATIRQSREAAWYAAQEDMRDRCAHVAENPAHIIGPRESIGLNISRRIRALEVE